MRVEYTNPFISSTHIIFEKEVHMRLKRKNLVKKDNPSPTMPISILIGVTGVMWGQVVFSMDRGFAFCVTQSMMAGNKSSHEVNGMINSAVGEIANMITGRASIELAGENGLITITPPQVFTSRKMSVDFVHIPTISLSFIAGIGIMEINLALKEEDERCINA